MFLQQCFLFFVRQQEMFLKNVQRKIKQKNTQKKHTFVSLKLKCFLDKCCVWLQTGEPQSFILQPGNVNWSTFMVILVDIWRAWRMSMVSSYLLTYSAQRKVKILSALPSRWVMDWWNCGTVFFFADQTENTSQSQVRKCPLVTRTSWIFFKVWKGVLSKVNFRWSGSPKMFLNKIFEFVLPPPTYLMTCPIIFFDNLLTFELWHDVPVSTIGASRFNRA